VKEYTARDANAAQFPAERCAALGITVPAAEERWNALSYDERVKNGRILMSQSNRRFKEFFAVPVKPKRAAKPDKEEDKVESTSSKPESADSPDESEVSPDSKE